MKLVTVTQWVRADTAQVPPDQSLASRSGANCTGTPGNGNRANGREGKDMAAKRPSGPLRLGPCVDCRSAALPPPLITTWSR
jgi:hypothetical protein